MVPTFFIAFGPIFLERSAILLAGLLADRFFGDFKRLQPFISHPVILIGNFIGFYDANYNRPENHTKTQQLVNGLFFALGVIFLAGLVGWLFKLIADFIFEDFILAKFIFEGFLVGWLVAHKSLVEAGLRVENFIKRDKLPEARLALKWLAGRQSNEMGARELRLTVIECWAENFSDGVMAPIFWYLLFGLPGLFAYKAVNTLDSMVGYRSVRHIYFGRASAIIDDIANFIPARLSAFWLVLSGICFYLAKGRSKIIHPFAGFLSLWSGFSILAHIRARLRGETDSSPNAVIVTGAMAELLGLQLGGERFYLGADDVKPRRVVTITGKGHREAGEAHMESARRLMGFAEILFFAYGLFAYGFFALGAFFLLN